LSFEAEAGSVKVTEVRSTEVQREEFYEMFNFGKILVCLLTQLNASLQERNLQERPSTLSALLIKEKIPNIHLLEINFSSRKR